MLKRKAYDRLLEWKKNRNGKTALLIEGARRVGKSTLVEEFGRNEYASCLIVDFFQAPAEVRQYFEDYRTDFDTLFLYLSTYYGVDLHERDTLIVFDEVQMFPTARGLLKYLVADGRYDYIETGSCPSSRTWTASWFRRRRNPSSSIRWISRNSFGGWARRSW